MKIEVQKAKAFEIDPTKNYAVFYESEVSIPMADAVKIKEKMVKMFEGLGVKNVKGAVVVKGKVIVQEVKK